MTRLHPLPSAPSSSRPPPDPGRLLAPLPPISPAAASFSAFGVFDGTCGGACNACTAPCVHALDDSSRGKRAGPALPLGCRLQSGYLSPSPRRPSPGRAPNRQATAGPSRPPTPRAHCCSSSSRTPWRRPAARPPNSRRRGTATGRPRPRRSAPCGPRRTHWSSACPRLEGLCAPCPRLWRSPHLHPLAPRPDRPACLSCCPALRPPQPRPSQLSAATRLRHPLPPFPPPSQGSLRLIHARRRRVQAPLPQERHHGHAGRGLRLGAAGGLCRRQLRLPRHGARSDDGVRKPQDRRQRGGAGTHHRSRRWVGAAGGVLFAGLGVCSPVTSAAAFRCLHRSKQLRAPSVPVAVKSGAIAKP